MTHTNPIFIEAFAPIILLIIYGRIKMYRRRAKLAAEGHAEPEFTSTEPIRLPLTIRLGMRLFPHSSPAEDIYLRTQLHHVRSFFLAGLYYTLAATTPGIFYDTLHIPTADASSGPYLWANFLDGWINSPIPFFIFALIAGFIFSSQIVGASYARFYRSRPITLSYMFWTRACIGTLTLLATLITGFALSFALLVAIRGPVWSKPDPHVRTYTIDTATQSAAQLRSADRPPVVTLGNPTGPAPTPANHTNVAMFRSEVFAYFTSPFRIALSNIFSTLAIFAFMALLGTLPFRTQMNKSYVSGAVWGFTFVLITSFQALHNQITSRFALVFFRYPRLGVPPPYIFALVPLALFAVFFILARICFTYRES